MVLQDRNHHPVLKVVHLVSEVVVEVLVELQEDSEDIKELEDTEAVDRH